MGLYCSLSRTEKSARATPDVWNGVSNGVPYGTEKEIHYWHRSYNGIHGLMRDLYYARGGTDPEFNCKVIDLNKEELRALAFSAVEGFLEGGYSFDPAPVGQDTIGQFLEAIKECEEWLDAGWYINYSCCA